MRPVRLVLITAAAAVGACGGGGGDGDDDDDVRVDAAAADAATIDGVVGDGAPMVDAWPGDGSPGDGPTIDGAIIDAAAIDAAAIDAAAIDAAAIDAAAVDAQAIDAQPIDGPAGVITGGPCLSGAPGATGYRIRWANGGSTTYPVYEVNGLPDHSRDHAGAYGYQIGYTPQFVDPFLGEGGLALNSSSFVDLQLTTVGIASISSAHLSIYGRSYSTGSSGSFNWQTWDGSGTSPTNLVSNVAPYRWYSADMTTEISPGDDGVLIRIKAGPSSGSLVVNRIELCLQAN